MTKSAETRSKMAAGHIESYYLQLRRNTIYTALEDLPDTEWFWAPSEIKEFDWLWEKDMPIKDIAREMGRSEIAVFLLGLDRMHKEQVKLREWKIW